MFLENSPYSFHSMNGWIEVITGSMFSGKTEELMRRLKRAQIANQEVLLVKPTVDTRNSTHQVVSHDDKVFASISIDNAKTIHQYSEQTEVFGIDEAQFFNNAIVEVCNDLADLGKRIIIAGLDMDYSGKPFHPIPELMAIAEYITKVHAICIRCGRLAHYSHRKADDGDTVLIGASEKYEPLCRTCYSLENSRSNA